MKTNPTQSNSKISNWVSNLDMKDHPLAKLIASIKIIRKTNCYDPQERDRTKKSNKTIQKQHQCGKTKEVEENYRENQKKVFEDQNWRSALPDSSCRQTEAEESLEREREREYESADNESKVELFHFVIGAMENGKSMESHALNICLV